MSSSRGLVLLVSSVLACAPPQPTPRTSWQRTPPSSGCDVQDGTRCLLPWPNNGFTVLDAATPTGLRVSLQNRVLPNPDSAAPLNRLDGFSVIGGLAVGFPSRISVRTDPRPATAMRLFQATPGENRGSSIALRLSVTADAPGEASLLVGYPLRPMRYETDYVAVVLDEVKDASGVPLVAPRRVKVALGLQKPSDEAEAEWAAFNAPVRALLTDAQVDLARVLRVWEFTTRSAQSVRVPFEVMRTAALEAAKAGAVTIRLDRVNPLLGTALEVRGALEGLPRFTQKTGELALDENQRPVQVGTHATPFRVVLPAGTGPYPIVVYGHGTGGTVYDDTFDKDIIGEGAAKLNLEYSGWTESTVLDTLVGLDKRFTGSERSTGQLVQALVDASALEALLETSLGDLLAQPTLLSVANPAAGRRNDLSRRVYAGGSMGGTLGFVHTLNEPSIRGAVLNVPGAGWTHFVPTSAPFSTLDTLFATTTPSPLDRALSVVMTQGSWDLIDGAAWAGLSTRPKVDFLIQESMGDPVLPNIGTHLVATSSQAVQVGAVLEPVDGVETVAEAVGRTALTQFRISNRETNLIARHGFGGKDTEAGRAARQQIVAFLRSVWAGSPRITVPEGCVRGGLNSCDFGDAVP